MEVSMIASDDALRHAHAWVVDILRRGESLALPVPSSHDVKAVLNRVHTEFYAQQHEVLRRCRDLGLGLSDARSEPELEQLAREHGRPRNDHGDPPR